MSKTSIRKHYDEVATLGCILCRHLKYGSTPAEVHHVRRLGAVRDTAPVIPLCPEHHRGNSGVHGMGKKAFARHYGVSEEDLLVMVNYLLTK